nr:hypothetical protein CFP56_32211 [Quercus suber]
MCRERLSSVIERPFQPAANAIKVPFDFSLPPAPVPFPPSPARKSCEKQGERTNVVDSKGMTERPTVPARERRRLCCLGTPDEGVGLQETLCTWPRIPGAKKRSLGDTLHTAPHWPGRRIGDSRGWVFWGKERREIGNERLARGQACPGRAPVWHFADTRSRGGALEGEKGSIASLAGKKGRGEDAFADERGPASKMNRTKGEEAQASFFSERECRQGPFVLPMLTAECPGPETGQMRGGAAASNGDGPGEYMDVQELQEKAVRDVAAFCSAW